MFPITTTGLVAIAAAVFYLSHVGLRKGIIDPYWIICFHFFRFFGFPLKDASIALRVDMANLLAFICFSVVFLAARKGTPKRAHGVLQRIWPHEDRGGAVPSLSDRAILLCASLAVGYAAYNLWVSRLQYGGLEQALVRFYAMQPLEEISPWLIRARRILYWLAVLMIFTLRLNYAAHRRGLVALWIAFVAMVFVAFPAGAVGAFVAPVVAFLIADVVAAIQRGTRFRPRLDLIAVLAVAVLGGMLLLMIRGKRFRSLEDMVDYVLGNPQVVSTKLFEKTGEHHLIVSESVGYCLQNFGRRQEFLWLHTPYSILVNPIPRELWPGKPLAFGRALAQIWRDEFGVPGVPVVGPSYAAGLAGEGYANGGWAGVVLLSAVVGYLCGKAAKYALIGLFTPSYPIVMVGLALFRFSIVFVRGDMLSAWTMTVYPLVVLVFGLALADRILRKAARDAVSPVDRRASGGGPP